MKTWTIYKHTLQISDHKGWSYVGQSCATNLNARWKNGKGYREDHGKVFFRAVVKYGWDNFSHEILESNLATKELANEREKYWVAFFHTWIGDPECRGYNMTPGGDQWGNCCFHWYNNGIKEIVINKEDIVPDGFILGRLPMSDTQKKKLKAYTKTTGHKNKQTIAMLNRVHINKDGIDKLIKQTELVDYIEAGWSLGKSKAVVSKQYKKIRCIETGEVFNSLQEATIKYGHHVIDVLKGRRNKTHNCHFEYI